jgi:hypothetical protein
VNITDPGKCDALGQMVKSKTGFNGTKNLRMCWGECALPEACAKCPISGWFGLDPAPEDVLSPNPNPGFTEN